MEFSSVTESGSVFRSYGGSENGMQKPVASILAAHQHKSVMIRLGRHAAMQARDAEMPPYRADASHGF